MPKLGKTKKNNKKKNSKRNKFWALKIFFITLIISVIFSIISQKTLSTSNNLLLPLSIILIIILIGVIFDIIGIAVAAAPEKPFVSMSAKKIRGAKQALKLIKNADLVSNFCNDVVGDICGIISGAAGSMLVIKVMSIGLRPDALSMMISSFIAAITVGGKALGKGFAIDNSQRIVYSVGYILSLFSIGRPKQKDDRLSNKKEA